MNRFFVGLILFLCISPLTGGQVRNLDYYLKEGLSGSPLIKDYANQFSSVRFDSLLVRAGKKPQIEARSTFQYLPAYEKFGYDEVITDKGNYQAMVGVSQDIFSRREVNNRLDALNILRKSLTNTTRISSNELTRLITDQFLASVSAYNDLSFNKTFLDLLYNENDIVKQLASKGIYKQTDYLAILVETQTQEIFVRQLISRYESNLRQLNVICGINDTVSYVLTMPEIKLTGGPDITKSPGYFQYKIDSLKIINEKASVDVRYRLKVSWFADAGFLAHDPSNFYNHFGYSAGLSLSVPIYDGNQRSTEKQKLDIEENTRGNYRDNFLVRYNQQYLQLFNELKSEKEISSSLGKQLSTSENLLQTLKAELESGLIPMTDYISAVKNFRIINKNLSDSRIRILQIISELNYLINQ